MKIHLISDIHLQINDVFNIPKIDADVCVLAGDIGLIRNQICYYDFLKAAKKQFKNVILVNGNHEFYHSDYAKSLQVIKSIADDADVYLMDIHYNTENLTIDGVTFWGSTLWTDFNNNDLKTKNAITKGFNDYVYIKHFNANIVYETYLETVKRINWNADVVITHTMPILRDHTRFLLNSITYGFCCTKLEEQIKESNIKYWLYGHSHDNMEYTVGQTKILSNQVGYLFEKMNKPYNSNLIIDI